MAKMSISICKGKGSLNHNNRVFVTDNVDRERIKDDITYTRESLESAYEHCFGEAIEQYNAQQKRSDRKIDGVAGYMEKIRNSKNGEKLFYEILVQVGNMFDAHVGTPTGDMAAKVLDAYMRDFQVNNPNIYVFNAVLHLDEQTPHLHIDYIPVAKGYKQGMMIRNSLDKALKQQGISGKATRFENSTIAWQSKEKDRIEVIMREYGLERAEETGLSRGHLTVDQFKAVAEQVSNEVASLPDQIESKPTLLDKDRVIVRKSDLEQLEHRAKLSVVHEEAISEAMKGVEKEKERAGARFEKAQGQLDNELRGARSDHALAHRAKMDAELDREGAERERIKQSELRAEAEKLVAEQQTLNARYLALQVENERLRNSVAEQKEVISKLTAENGFLKAQIEAIKSKLTDLIDSAKKPLQDRIAALETKVENMAKGQFTLMKAVRYVRDQFSGEVGFALLNAVLLTGNRFFREDGFEEYSKDRSVGLASSVRANIQMELKYRKGDDGKGLYTDKGVCVIKADSISEARELMPNCTVKNEMNRGQSR